MRYTGGNGTVNTPERRPGRQQPRRFVAGMVIRLPGDGRYVVRADVGAMVGNVGNAPTFVQVSMSRVGEETVIVRPMSAHRFVEVVA